LIFVLSFSHNVPLFLLNQIMFNKGSFSRFNAIFGYFPCLLKRDHINHFEWFFAHKCSIMGVDLKVKQEFLCEIKGRLLLPLIQQIHNAERRFIDCMDWVSSHILP